MKLTEFIWDRTHTEIAKSRVGNKETALFLANEAKRLMDPYVPAKNLILAQNVRVYTEGANGVVEYLSPHAHYQFTGVLYVDKKTGLGAFTNGEGLFWSRPGVSKVPTKQKLNYSTFRHPLATSRWDKAMLTARKTDLTASVQRYINR